MSREEALGKGSSLERVRLMKRFEEIFLGNGFEDIFWQRIHLGARTQGLFFGGAFEGAFIGTWLVDMF